MGTCDGPPTLTEAAPARNSRNRAHRAGGKGNSKSVIQTALVLFCTLAAALTASASSLVTAWMSAVISSIASITFLLFASSPPASIVVIVKRVSRVHRRFCPVACAPSRVSRAVACVPCVRRRRRVGPSDRDSEWVVSGTTESVRDTSLPTDHNPCTGIAHTNSFPQRPKHCHAPARAAPRRQTRSLTELCAVLCVTARPSPTEAKVGGVKVPNVASVLAMPSRQERRKAERNAAKRAPGQAGAAGAGGAAAALANSNVHVNPVGDWTTQASDPRSLFQAQSLNVVKQRASAGDREAQFSQGYKLVSDADIAAGATTLGAAGISPSADVGFAPCTAHPVAHQTATRP